MLAKAKQGATQAGGWPSSFDSKHGISGEIPCRLSARLGLLPGASLSPPAISFFQKEPHAPANISWFEAKKGRQGTLF
ncbi:MAG: hypothetical protein DRH11_03235 [Deltaproteobacteria bacterium]|nr:MAG: hypothetical protein DRH11_03235 [Deltaproteobacteria bacterium]